MELGICRRTFACVRPLVSARRAGLALAAALLLSAGPSTATQTRPAAPAEPAGEQIVNLRPEVRLRKLHLVRPDLIQYPLQYDVYC
ncbi:MAG TPA: hypothetical protein VF796_00800 [Humisphaera sp.]